MVIAVETNRVITYLTLSQITPLRVVGQLQLFVAVPSRPLRLHFWGSRRFARLAAPPRRPPDHPPEARSAHLVDHAASRGTRRSRRRWWGRRLQYLVYSQIRLQPGGREILPLAAVADPRPRGGGEIRVGSVCRSADEPFRGRLTVASAAVGVGPRAMAICALCRWELRRGDRLRDASHRGRTFSGSRLLPQVIATLLGRSRGEGGRHILFVAARFGQKPPFGRRSLHS